MTRVPLSLFLSFFLTLSLSHPIHHCLPRTIPDDYSAELLIHHIDAHRRHARPLCLRRTHTETLSFSRQTKYVTAKLILSAQSVYIPINFGRGKFRFSMIWTNASMSLVRRGLYSFSSPTVVSSCPLFMFCFISVSYTPFAKRRKLLEYNIVK